MSNAIEMVNALDIEDILMACDSGVIRGVCDGAPDDFMEIRFCHRNDPDGENSFFATDLEWREFKCMEDDEWAQYVKDLLISLVEDDKETYGDEVAFYVMLIQEATE